DLPLFFRVMSPNAGEIVGVEFLTDGELIALDLAGSLAGDGDLLGNACQVLDMVPDLVGDDIRLSEVAIRSKLAVHFIEEGKVDIHPGIGRTVEGAGGG